MKRFFISSVVIASVVASSTVFADAGTIGKTRAEVRAELVQAQKAGLMGPSETTYPAAQLRAAAAQQAANPVATNAGTSAAGDTVTSRTQSGYRTVIAPQTRDSIYFGQ